MTSQGWLPIGLTLVIGFVISTSPAWSRCSPSRFRLFWSNFTPARITVEIGGLLLARLVLVSNRVRWLSLSRDGKSRAGACRRDSPGCEATSRNLVWMERLPYRMCMVRTVQHGHQSYVLRDLAEDDYQDYYNGYANRVLWPILHYRLILLHLMVVIATGSGFFTTSHFHRRYSDASPKS